MVCSTRKPRGSEDPSDGSNPPATSSTTTIESWIACKDRFRVVVNGPPTPRLSRIRRVDPEFESMFNDNILEIPKILARYGLSFTGSRLDRKEPSDRTYETIDVLSVSTDDTKPTSSWRDAANAILEFFKGMAPTHTQGPLQVQLVNEREAYDDISSALPNDPSLVRPLASIQDRILQCVEMTMENVWTSIAFHMRSRRNEYNAPRKLTVIVFCHPHSICDFATAEDRLLEILNTIELQICLEFLPGRNQLSDLETNSPVSLPMSLSIQPMNGSSIGVQGNKTEAGSLGGWLVLNLPQEKRHIHCAVTCYHVIRSDVTCVSEHTDTTGVHWDDPRGHVNVEYPSYLDAKATMSRLEEICALNPEDEGEQASRQILSNLMSGPGIGKVLLASGYQRRHNQRLDWALIESPNTFSPNKPTPYKDDLRFKIPTTGPRYNPHPGSQIRSIATVKPGSWVAKKGRTTTTSGEVSSLQRIVHWGPNNLSWEIEVVGFNDDFANGGDFGSFITDFDGNLVGLLFANAAAIGEFKVGYITPFSHIQNHVKEMTKGGFLSLDELGTN